MLDARRAFLADEQGLGKTVEALAALEADDAYPAIVVCPASLKLNWQREAAQLAAAPLASPSSRAAAPSRRRGDITILNYEIVAAHREQLGRAGARARSSSTSRTTCKNPQRQAHAGRAPARRDASRRDGLRLALTGTPVLNHAEELISQLRVLGRLEDFGSGARFARAVPRRAAARSACTGTCAGAASCAG